MDFLSDSAAAALLAILLIALLCISFLVLFPRKPVLPGPSLLDYLPGGNVHPMVQDTRNAGDVLKKMRETYGETFVMWYGSARTVIRSVPQDIAQVAISAKEFRRPDDVRCVSDTVAPGALFSMIGETHRAARKSMRGGFSHSMLQSFHSRMTDTTSELCNSLRAVAEHGAIDISKFLAVTTFRVLTNVAYGAEMGKEDRLKFNRVSNTLVHEMMKELLGYPIRQKLTCFGIRNGYLNSIQTIRGMCLVFIERRLAETSEQRKLRSPDMLDIFLEISNGDSNLAAALTIEFAVAGSHTTYQMLSWTLYELCCQTSVQTKLYNELDTVLGSKPATEPLTLEDLQGLKYVVQVWKEVLRRRPITNLLLRVATQDVQLKGSGVQIPKGTAVSAFYAYSQIDPQIWQDPLEFRPERWEQSSKSESCHVPPGAYLPFGGGELSCAGKFLADYEGPLIIAELYRRFRFELACRPEQIKRRSHLVDVPQYMNDGVDEGVPVSVFLREK